MRNILLSFRFSLFAALAAAVPHVTTEALSCQWCWKPIACSNQPCTNGTSCNTYQVTRCDGGAVGDTLLPSCTYGPGYDYCSTCAEQNASRNDGCLNHGKKIAPDASQPQCLCEARCEEPNCDNPPEATCDDDDVPPSDEPEKCGDGLDNNCNGAVDEDCDPPEDKQPRGGGVCGGVEADLTRGTNGAGEDPIHLATRAAISEPFTDFSIEALTSLGITRIYSSADVSVQGSARGGVFGRGWHHDWEMELSCTSTGFCKVSQGSGAAQRYSRISTSSVGMEGSVTYIPPAPGIGPYAGETWEVLHEYPPRVVGSGERSVLARRPNGEYILYQPDGRELHFQADCARDHCSSTDNYCKDPRDGGRAHLVRVIDANGNAVDVGHDRPTGLLLALQDSLGHRLELRGSANACSDGLARTLTFDGVPYVAYEYGGDGRELQTVRVASSDGRGPVMRSYEYGYSGSTRRGFLARVRNESGDPIVEFGYDSSGWATSVTDSRSTVTVSYDDAQTATVRGRYGRGAGDMQPRSASTRRRGRGGGPAAATFDRGMVRHYEWLRRKLRCSQDEEGRTHYFDRDSVGRVTRHAMFAAGAYECSSTAPPAATLEPLLEEWFEYGLNREVAEGVFVPLDVVTRSTQRSALAQRIASGTPFYDRFTSTFSDHDPQPKAGDPSGYSCTPAGVRLLSAPCRTVVNGYTLDAQGGVVAEQHTTFFTYDGKGRLTRRVGPVLTSGPARAGDVDAVEERSYWPDSGGPEDLPRLGRLREVRRFTGTRALVTSYDYDVFGPYQITDPSGRVTLIPRDARGRPLAVATPDGRVVAFRYYDEEKPRTISLNSGAALRLSYDLRGRVALIEALSVDPESFTPITPGGPPLGLRWTESHEYDPAGNAVTVERKDALGTVRFRQLREYDEKHRLTTQSHPEYLDELARWDYDAVGRLSRFVDEEGRAVELVPDAMGRTSLVRRTGKTPSGAPVSLDVGAYTYDPDRSTIRSVTDGEGRTTSYRRDDFDRLLTVESPSALAGAVRYEYDVRGNVRARAWGSTTTSYVYDGVDRLTRIEAVSSSGAPPVTYAFRYDENPGDQGRLTSVVEGDRTTVYGYDEVGRLRYESVTVSGESSPLVTEYRYDADGNLDTIVYPTGLSVRYERDPATGRPTAVRDVASGVAFASEIAYLPQGPLSGLSFGNGASLTQAFSLRYEPLSIQSGPLELGYTVSLSGDIAAIAKGADRDDLAYDFADRLTNRRSTNGVRAEPLDFVYAGGRMVQALDRETGRPRYAYGYDDQSNLSSVSRYDGAGTSLASTFCLVHDALGRLVVAGHASPTAGGPNALACRSEADVVQVIARFRYDAYNRRVARQDAGGSWTHFVFAGGNPLSEVVASTSGWTTLRDYVWLEDRPLAQVEYPAPSGGSPGNVYYFHADHLGTPHALTNSARQTIWSATVLPYGEVLESGSPDPLTGRTVVTNLRLPGQYDERLLGTLGLQGPYYNWNRWYLPGVGRYLEPDPIALGGGFNGEFGPEWYGYASQNPLLYFDMSGLCDTALEGRWFDTVYKSWLRSSSTKAMGCGPLNGILNAFGDDRPMCMDFADALIAFLDNFGGSSCCRAVKVETFWNKDKDLYNWGWGYHASVAVRCTHDEWGRDFTIRDYNPHYRSCWGP